jgi:hypothetical protein
VVSVVTRWVGDALVQPRMQVYRLKPGRRMRSSLSMVSPDTVGEAPALRWLVVTGGRDKDTLSEGTERIRTARTGRYADASSGQSAAGLSIDDSMQVVLGRGSWSGPEDCSARAWVFRAGGDLRVAVDVTDDRLNAGAEEPHLNDGIEIYLDVRPEATRGIPRYGPGVYQLSVVPGLGGRPHRLGGIARKGAPMDSVRIRSVPSDNGYRIEVLLPQALLEFEGMSPGPTFNLDIGINDADAGRRESQLMWSGSSSNWSDPRGFGRMRPSSKEAT